MVNRRSSCAPSPTAGPFDLAALTSDVLALIDRWSPGRPVELIGHDRGALITYDACVTAPERIETRGHARNPSPTHVHEPADARRSATPELVHGALSTAGKRLDGHRPRSRPHRPPLASVVARLLARSCSPGGAHEHLRASMPAPLKYYRAMLRPGMLGATRRLSQPIAVPCCSFTVCSFRLRIFVSGH